jgi:trimeric autotransporter adhesin
MSFFRAFAGVWLMCVLAAPAGLAAADQYGRVTFGGVPVPGATVTATRENQQRVTVTDQQGVYRFAGIADGVWTLRIEMLGFATINQDVTVAADTPAPTWDLKLLPFEEITRGLPPPSVEPKEQPRAPIAGRQAGAAPLAAPPAAPSGFQRAQVNTSANAGAITNDPTAADADRNQGAADGFLINGSVNNGAASPFAQLAAFGNNRRGGRSLYNGGLGVLLGNSAWDARPFSFTSQQTPKPSYSDVQILGSFAGPLKIPGVIKNGPTLLLGYQRTVDHNASTQSALMPTLPERAGNFSHTIDRFGQPLRLVDPATGLPFAGNIIPSALISPQAASLLNYYPLPNLDAGGQYNYQTPTLVTTHQDAVQSRFSKVLDGGRHQLFGNLAYQRTTTDTSNMFAFVDSSRVSGLDTTLNWSHRLSQFRSVRLRYQFTRLSTNVTPYFANRTNVSGEAGIGGTNQDPVNWGPPRLIFSSGVAGLSSLQAAQNRNQTQAWGGESLWNRGRHNITFGGDIRRQQWNVFSQQDARGTFAFNGAATGSDLADFLLGLPHASSIAFGNADKYLRAPAYDAYVTDDWRVNPVLTVNAGVRWEYEAPVTEWAGRLVNLDVAPGFTAVSPIVATNPVGALTGRSYPDSLMRPDRRGLQPRVGLAWRPVAGSSLVVRAGYGIYRNTSVYEPIAVLLAQQTPLSNTLSVENSAAHPLTLANGFTAPSANANTFAVDPDLRVGSAHNWQLLVQRDLPASLTITATYLGTAGSHLMQEFLPNTVPLGAVNPCRACPEGFVYLTANGHSNKQTGQLQLRRRLRNGLSAMVQYALSKATDDAGAFTGVRLDGAAIAQDWRHLEAEEGPSNFDQRHLLTAQVQYTTGVGVSGGGMLDGVRGTLFKGWTVTSQLTAGSGLPLTPVYLTSVAGTGVTGTIRPDVASASTDAAPAGFFVNPGAYTAPAPGQWGNAGRNSITGPRQFALDAGVGRSFLSGDRLTLDWRLNVTNVLNRVTYANVNTIFGSPQFGLATLANPMRKVQSSVRLRF